MMPERPVFRVVEIEDFRGFRRAQEFEIDASAVIVVGSNGTGKTSFFDALQWLLLGALPRLGAYANRRSEDYVVNRWSNSGVATVGAELRIDGRRVYVRRSGTADRSRLELHDHDGISWDAAAQQRLASLFLMRERISLPEAMTTSGLLQQDAVRVVIENEPKERYAHLTRLLGLEALPAYGVAARSNADALAKEARELRAVLERVEAQRRDASADLERATKQVADAPGVLQMLRDIEATLGSNAAALAIIGSFPIDGDDLSRLGTAARRLRERAAELLAEGQRLTGELVEGESSPEQLQRVSERAERLASDLMAAEVVLLAAKESLEVAERTGEQLADLATRALPLLSEHCPVCLQPIQREDVRVHLMGILTGEAHALLALRASVEDATVRQNALEQDRSRTIQERDRLIARKAQFDRHNAETRDWATACAALADGIGSLRPVDAAGVRAGHSSALEAVRQAAGGVERATREAAAALAVPELSGRIEQQRARTEQLAADVQQLRDSVAAANRRAEEARALSRATTEAITNVTKRRFETLAPLVAEIYARLDPHPAFTRLDYALGVYYQRPIADPVVIDEERDVTANPLLVFSSSQANVAALTFFLAMSWTAGSHALPFLLLDDPLQAMDDVNALGFADLCRHIRGARQLIVSTHDRRLGSLLERKLAPRAAGNQTRVLRFVGWDRSGPQIEQEFVEPQLEAAERRVLMEAA
jgi:methyl-accepting chemotaxis protein